MTECAGAWVLTGSRGGYVVLKNYFILKLSSVRVMHWPWSVQEACDV